MADRVSKMGAMPAGVPMLRPLSVGEILDASFKVYGRNFVTMAKAILVVAIPFSLISALIHASITTTTTTSSGLSGLSGSNTTTSTSVSAAVGLLLVELVTIVSAAVSTAIIYRVVGDAYLGQPPSWRVALRGGLRKANSVLWLTFLTIVVYALGIGVTVAAIVLAIQVSPALGVLLGFVLGIPAICAGVWFFVAAQLAVPSLMLEDYRGLKALLRGVRLSRHLWWRCFGCLLLIGLIVGILTDIVSGVALALLLAVAHSKLARVAVYLVTSVLATVLFSPITASALVVLSIDLRVRKEGYDIQLLASQLGPRPGATPLSFFPRPPVMWGGPPSPWAQPGPQGWNQPGPPAWGQPGPPAWGQSGPHAWGQPGPPAWNHPGPPVWGQPTAPGWGPPQPVGPPGWVPPAPPPAPSGTQWGPQDPPASPPPPPHQWESTSQPPLGLPHPNSVVLPPPPPPPRPTSALTGWVPPGQPEPALPPPLFGPSGSEGVPQDPPRTEDHPHGAD